MKGHVDRGQDHLPHPASYSDIVVLDDHTIGYVYERADKAARITGTSCTSRISISNG